MDLEDLKKAINGVLDERKSADEPAKPTEKGAEASFDVEKLVEALGNKFADAIKESKGLQAEEVAAMKAQLFGKDVKAIEFPEPSAARALPKEKKIPVFFKSLVMYKSDPEAYAVFRALVEGTDSEGGYLVPEEFRSEIWRILPDVGVMRKLATVLPMSTDTLNLNSLTASPVAYWAGEYSQLTTSSAEFGRKVLTPFKLIVLLPISQELMADANVDLAAFITQLFAEKIAEKEDEAYFTGDGSAKPEGLAAASLPEIDAGGNISFDDVIDAIFSRPQSVRQSRKCAFVANKHAIQQLVKIKDNNGNYIWSPGDPNSGVPETLYRYPLYEQNSLAHNVVLFGDFKYYIIGDRQQLTVETTTEGGDAWRRDAMEIKAKIRVDGLPMITGAFVKITNV